MEANSDLFEDTERKTAEVPGLIDLIKEYVDTNIEIGKLTLIERLTNTLANLITDAFVVVMLLLVFIFGSASLGFYLGDVVGSTAGGFGLVTLIYFSLAMLMYFTKDNIVDKFLINFMIKRITNKKNNGKSVH